MKQSIKKILTHSAAFGAGMICQQFRASKGSGVVESEQLRQRVALLKKAEEQLGSQQREAFRTLDPTIVDVLLRGSPTEIEAMMQSANAVQELIRLIKPIAEANAIILGVLAEARRAIPGMAEDMGDLSMDEREVFDFLYAQVLKAAQEAAPERKDLEPLFAFAATVVAKYASLAISGPSGIPTTTSADSDSMVSEFANRVGAAFEQHAREIGELSTTWRKKGRPTTQWIALERIADAAQEAADVQ
jgi:hypothetical protein